MSNFIQMNLILNYQRLNYSCINQRFIIFSVIKVTHNYKKGDGALKRIYKTINIMQFKIKVFFRKIIINIFEIIKIYRNRSYKKVKWSKKQKEEFNSYWKMNYGKRISNKTHRIYESINGKYNIEYVPDRLFSTKLEFNFNDYDYSTVFSNKTLIPTLFNGIEG